MRMSSMPDMSDRPSQMPRRVQIVGAGLGGLAAAIACARAGADVQVTERALVLGEVGAGIQLSPNAMKALRWLGVDVAAANPFRPDALELRMFDSGRRVYRAPLDTAAEARWGAPYLQVHRADLHAVLLDAALAAGVDLRLGMDVAGYERLAEGGARLIVRPTAEPAILPTPVIEERRQRPRAVSLHPLGEASVPIPEPFKDAPFDLILGADGIRSVIREKMLPMAGHVGFSGNVAYRGTVPAAALAPGLVRPVASVWMGPQRHFVHYYVRGGAMVNFIAVCERAEWTPEGWGAQSDIAALRAEFADWHPTVRGILAGAETAYEWGLFHHEPFETWHDGPVALMGDAAHPMAPFLAQGAAMAFEDAVTLGRALPIYGVRYGLEAYEKLRAGRCAHMQQAAARTGRRFHSRNRLDRFVKATAIEALGHLSPRTATGLNDWIYGHDAGRAPV
jgi:salicylate hydroxylase